MSYNRVYASYNWPFRMPYSDGTRYAARGVFHLPLASGVQKEWSAEWREDAKKDPGK